MRTDTGTKISLADYAPTPYAAPTVSLMVALHPTATIVKNTTRYEPRGENAGPLVLEGDALTLVSAELSGIALAPHEFEATADRFVLHNPPTKGFDLTLVTSISPDENTELMGLYRSNGVYCTQCEAEGFRRITYAYDRPDVLSVYDVSILSDGPGDPVLLSNGNPGITGETDGRKYAMWHDPHPKPSYLFALVAGDLGVAKETFTTKSGKKVELAIYVERGKEPRTAYAMEALKRSMRWDEVRFGLEYDLTVFNIVAVSDFNMGAMENKGLNVFNDRYILADPTVATDVDYANIEAIVAHEYFHNWTGNRITCRDWFQLCLKEGLTVYRDQEFTSDVRSRGVKRIEDARRLRLAQFREDASPLRHPVRPREYAEISNLYTATVYEKGAELVRMIETIIGQDAFRAGMDRYFERFDGTAATIEDFLGAFEPLDIQAFMPWYNEPGTPKVTVAHTFEGGTTTLTFTQTPADGATLKPIPIRLALLGAEGTLDLSAATVTGGTLNGDCLLMEGAGASLALGGLSEQPVPSVFRAFSAPVLVDQPTDPARDLALLARDDDPFTAWDAAQRLLIDALRAHYDGAPKDVAPLAESLAAAAAAPHHEPATRAFILQLPTPTSLVDAIGSNVDTDKIIAAHKAIASAIGRQAATTLRDLLAAPQPEPHDVSADAAGKRALKNAALHLLTASGEVAPALSQASTAGTMTDRLAALTALTAATAPEADGALTTFHDAYAREPLVLDKYFALQALRTDGAPLARVRALMSHPGFSLSNPNRTRSLIGAFTQNLSAFNAADGTGYRFLAEIAGELDAKNPQVAARLLTAFGPVTRMDQTRRDAGRTALETLTGAKRSSDVADIVRRLLSA